jgi:hypothetical protein
VKRFLSKLLIAFCLFFPWINQESFAARDFNGSTQFLDTGSAIVSAADFTISLWANRDALISTTEERMIAISDASSTDEYGFYTLEVAGTDYIIFKAYDGSGHSGAYTVSPPVGEWHHYVAIEDGDSRNVYYDGAAGTANNDTVTLTGLDETTIGCAQLSGGTNYHFNGQIAEVAIWNVILSASEITMLSLGVSPLFVRPQSLVSYWPIIGRTSPEIDLVGGDGMVLNASPATAVHLAMAYPASPYIATTPAVAPTGQVIMISSIFFLLLIIGRKRLKWLKR